MNQQPPSPPPETSPSPPRTILGDASIYSVAMFLSQGMLVLAGFILMRTLVPAMLGVWRTIRVILLYTPVAEIGTANGVVRQVPFYRSRREKDRGAAVSRTAYATNLAAALGIAILFGALAVYSWATGHKTWALALGVTSILAASWQFFFFLEFYFVAEKRFGTKSLMQVLYAGSFLLGVVILGQRFGLPGIFGAAILSHCIPVGVGLCLFADRFRPRFRTAEFKELARIGLPVSLRGFATTYLRTVDQIVIARALGMGAMGIYGPAVLILNMLILFPTALQQVITPRVVELYGGREEVHDLLPLLSRATRGIAWCMGGIVPLAVLLVGPAINWILPRYAESIAPARVLIFGAYFFALTSGTGGFFLATKKMFQLIGIQVLSAMSILGGCIGVALLGRGIVWMAIAVTSGYALYAALHLTYVFSHLEKLRHVLSFGGKILVPLLWGGVWFWVLGRIPFWGIGEGMSLAATLGVRTGLFLLAYAILAVPAMRGLARRRTGSNYPS